MRYGQKCLGKHRKMGSTYCAQCCPVFISSKNSVKIWFKKNLLRHCRYDAIRRGSKSHFSKKKMHFSSRKWHFFEQFILYKNEQWPKIQFLSKWVKNNFLLSHPKLVFFTRFYLGMTILTSFCKLLQLNKLPLY